MTEQLKECNGCGNEAPDELYECPHCGAEKCNMCDMGDNVACNNCPEED
ncbi:hypothetical protein EDF88_4528 [Buttiauxella sp. BIGb0552]|nr:hypothetical protein [Buttiauxella sp. BIGb0552]TDX11930.1 hypothetical protein EDF88_4528 [Buttiauxella sp. BIGb0552]